MENERHFFFNFLKKNRFRDFSKKENDFHYHSYNKSIVLISIKQIIHCSVKSIFSILF